MDFYFGVLDFEGFYLGGLLGLGGFRGWGLSPTHIEFMDDNG
jgi:hypothetical protein